MAIKDAFAGALKQARKARGLTQEDFSDISSRTYISTLERGLKSPTLDKLDALSKTLGIHPLTLLVMTYLIENKESNLNNLIEKITVELQDVMSSE